MSRYFFHVVVFASVFASGYSDYLKKLQTTHKPQELSNSDLQYLSNLSDTKHIDEVLDNILIPRVVGTPNHEKVFNYIKRELEKLKWSVEVDEFDDKTPNFGVLKFKNIVARLNPVADRYLTLACHYDSKYFKYEEFVGATDSAVPCAMMLNLIKVMDKDLSSMRENSRLSLQLIFFDGEEAFVNWGPKDSIYGARHLADLHHNRREIGRNSGESVSELQKMDMLILLDLIGHSHPTFYSYFPDTQKWYVRLVNLEDRLNRLQLLKKRNSVYFRPAAHYGRIEDDHIPFLQKGVPILHLISSPFPDVWHTPEDDRSIVDINATEDINKILRAFVAEYLHLSLEVEDIPEKEL